MLCAAVAFVCAAALLTSAANVHGEDEANATLRFATFNAYLAFEGQNFSERLSALTEQLSVKSTTLGQADAICLQEVESQSSIRKIREAAKGAGFVHSYSFLDALPNQPKDIARRKQPACGNLQYLLALQTDCLRTLCVPGSSAELQTPRQLVSCVRLKCSQLLDKKGVSFSPECINCLITRRAVSSQALASCTASNEQPKSEHPTTFGLLLLSKHPLYNGKAVPFPRYWANVYSRGYLDVELRSTNRAGNWKTICTHLYPHVIGAAYSGDYDSDILENLNNTARVLAASSQASNVVLMGDMNHGPASSAGSTAIFDRSYKHVLQAGYCAPYAEATAPECTFCVSNANRGTAGGASEILDHVYVRHKSDRCPASTARRILTANIANAKFPLSDHYGVEVTITVPTVQASGDASRLSASLGLALLTAMSALSSWF